MSYAIVDIETTGGHASANGITEVAIYVHDGERITDSYQTLINPGMPIPINITGLTGITNDMVQRAPEFWEVADKIYELLKGNIFIAHNVNFDYSFLKSQLSDCGYDLTTNKLCTVRLSRKIFPGLDSYGLGKICGYLDIKIESRQ
jgi:DNA polymerase-3 subunit epsilon